MPPTTPNTAPGPHPQPTVAPHPATAAPTSQPQTKQPLPPELAQVQAQADAQARQKAQAQAQHPNENEVGKVFREEMERILAEENVAPGSELHKRIGPAIDRVTQRLRERPQGDLPEHELNARDRIG